MAQPQVSPQPGHRPVVRRKAISSDNQNTKTVTSIPEKIVSESPIGKGEDIYASICTHCRKGMKLQDDWTLCLFCSVEYCTDCAPSHEPSHKRYTIHVKIKLEPEPEVANCAQCNAECKTGYVCQECPDRFCGACVYDRRAEFFEIHPHRRFTVTWISATNGLSSEGVLACRKYCNGHKDAVLAHCGTCYKGLNQLKDKSHECITCESSPVYCEDCGKKAQELEPQHCYITSQWTIRPQEEILELRKGGLVQCTICYQRFHGTKDPAMLAHPHTDYILLLWSAFVETYAGKLYRECGAKAPRRQICPNGTKERVCAWCKMPAPDKEYCLKCMEDESDYDGYCPRCRDEFGDMHRHGKEWFVSFENSIKIPAKAFPGCMAFFDKRTKREWFVPSSSIGYTYSSFTAPIRLMSGWSWYNDAWGDAFLVNEDKQLAVRQSLLDIPSSTWQQLKEQLPGWRRVDISAPVDGYTHTTTGIFLEACPVTDATLRDNPLPEGWVLVYDSRSTVPRFCNYYKNTKVFTQADPRLTHVQWRPRSLPGDWRLVEEAGRCRFLPPNAKFLSNVPPHVHDNELDRGQIPITISPQAQNAARPPTMTKPSNSAPATPTQQHESRPSLTPSSSTTTISTSTSSTLSPTSTNNSTSSVSSSVPPKKPKLSKTEIMRLCLQGLSIGVQVGTAVAGMPINLNLGSLVPMSMTSSDAPVADSGASYSTDTYVSDYQ